MKKHVLAFCLSFVLGTMMAANMGGANLYVCTV